MIDLLCMFKCTLIKNIEKYQFALSHLCEYCFNYYTAQKTFPLVVWDKQIFFVGK